LQSAGVARKRLFDRVLEFKSVHGMDNKKLQKKYLVKFMSEVNDDLNTPKALATMWEVISDSKLSHHDKYFLLLQFDRVFGFNLGSLVADKAPMKVIDLAEERLAARNAKDWSKSDKLRDKITKLGWIIGDTKEGYELKKK